MESVRPPTARLPGATATTAPRRAFSARGSRAKSGDGQRVLCAEDALGGVTAHGPAALQAAAAREEFAAYQKAAVRAPHTPHAPPHLAPVNRILGVQQQQQHESQQHEAKRAVVAVAAVECGAKPRCEDGWWSSAGSPYSGAMPPYDAAVDPHCRPLARRSAPFRRDVATMDAALAAQRRGGSAGGRAPVATGGGVGDCRTDADAVERLLALPPKPLPMLARICGAVLRAEVGATVGRLRLRPAPPRTVPRRVPYAVPGDPPGRYEALFGIGAAPSRSPSRPSGVARSPSPGARSGGAESDNASSGRRSPSAGDSAAAGGDGDGVDDGTNNNGNATAPLDELTRTYLGVLVRSEDFARRQIAKAEAATAATVGRACAEAHAEVGRWLAAFAALRGREDAARSAASEEEIAARARLATAAARDFRHSRLSEEVFPRCPSLGPASSGAVPQASRGAVLVDVRWRGETALSLAVLSFDSAGRFLGAAAGGDTVRCHGSGLPLVRCWGEYRFTGAGVVGSRASVELLLHNAEDAQAPGTSERAAAARAHRFVFCVFNESKPGAPLAGVSRCYLTVRVPTNAPALPASATMAGSTLGVSMLVAPPRSLPPQRPPVDTAGAEAPPRSFTRAGASSRQLAHARSAAAASAAPDASTVTFLPTTGDDASPQGEGTQRAEPSSVVSAADVALDRILSSTPLRELWAVSVPIDAAVDSCVAIASFVRGRGPATPTRAHNADPSSVAGGGSSRRTSGSAGGAGRSGASRSASRRQSSASPSTERRRSAGPGSVAPSTPGTPKAAAGPRTPKGSRALAQTTGGVSSASAGGSGPGASLGGYHWRLQHHCRGFPQIASHQRLGPLLQRSLFLSLRECWELYAAPLLKWRRHSLDFWEGTGRAALRATEDDGWARIIAARAAADAAVRATASATAAGGASRNPPLAKPTRSWRTRPANQPPSGGGFAGSGSLSHHRNSSSVSESDSRPRAPRVAASLTLARSN